ILLCLALQFYVHITQKIAADEFVYLSHIRDFQQGDLHTVMQNFHVHVFSYLPRLGLDDAKQILIGRAVMWVFEIGILVGIYGIGRAFLSRAASLFAVLVYISSGFILVYGASFRTDPLATAAVMICLFVMVRSPLRTFELALLACAVALGVMISVTVVFFLPALIGAALWRVHLCDHPRRLFVRLSLTALASLIIFTALYQYQIMALLGASGTGNIHSGLPTGIIATSLLPRIDTIISGLLYAPLQSLLLVLGMMLGVLDLFANTTKRDRAMVLFILASPLLSLLFYPGAYPYFYVFIFPSAVLFAGYFFDRIFIQRR
ncbi:MAG TPA: hypothetical protein ENJ46_05650, partial [Hellea balneolensis]|nr:hypothetical protein [Hellea balneolensis]